MNNAWLHGVKIFETLGHISYLEELVGYHQHFESLNSQARHGLHQGFGANIPGRCHSPSKVIPGRSLHDYCSHSIGRETGGYFDDVTAAI